MTSAPQTVQPVENGGGRLTNLAEKTASTAEGLYTSAKSRLPEAVRPRVEAVEEAAAPYVHKAQDTGERWGV